MRDATIARNYAEALVTLAQRAGDLDGVALALERHGRGGPEDDRVGRVLPGRDDSVEPEAERGKLADLEVVLAGVL